MYDLIIIGSGPAGLSAAVYGKRAGLNLLIIEEKPMSGGQILNTYEVDNSLSLGDDLDSLSHVGAQSDLSNIDVAVGHADLSQRLLAEIGRAHV